MNDLAAVAPPAVKPTGVRYGVLGWACALSMITYIDRVCFKQVGGEIAHELGLTDIQLGMAFAAFALSYALFEVPSGWLGDLLGPRKVLTRIVICWSVFTALTGAAWNLNSLVAIRFLFGAGEAGAYPNSARALRSWFPYRQRGLAQGMLWMFGRWGGAIASPLIYLVAQPLGWRGAFAVFGLLGLVWVVGFYTWFRDTPDAHPAVNDAERALIAAGTTAARPAPLSWPAMLTSANLWLLFVMYTCSNAGWCFFITWDVKYYAHVLKLSEGTLQLASGAPLFFGGIACLLGGFLTDRQVRIWGRRWGRTLQGLMAYLLGAAFFLLALATSNPWVAVPALCLASFVKDFAMAVSWSTCLDIGHRYSGTVAGFMNIGNLGTFVSPLVVPLLAGKDNWQVALTYSACMFLVSAVCWAFINPRRVIVYAPADWRRLRAEGALD
jgi:MFS transporter, ACS family, glucarate transporter